MSENTSNLDSTILFEPDWPAPANVKALISLRGLVDESNPGPYQAFNLGDHVGNAPLEVATNRDRFSKALNANVQWLNQTHSTIIHTLSDFNDVKGVIDADGSITQQAGLACCVMTADCLPILLCTKDGSTVAAIHCGWRGLANGMIAEAINAFSVPGDHIMAYLGPAISQAHFEVGSEVKESFELAAEQRGFNIPEDAFIDSENHGKYCADLYSLATSELQGLGIYAVYGGGFCTYAEPNRFYSYRRENKTGRMASAICILKP